MKASAKEIEFKGEKAVELRCGRYLAVVAPFLGSNVLRLCDEEYGIEILRYKESFTAEDYKKQPEVYGLPTLYLPNRLAGGVLKTSDATYHLPINDPLGNHIHGFLHKRAHEVVSITADEHVAVLKTAYTYDETDEFYQYLPLSFRAEFTFNLSENGLSYEFSMTNTGEKQLPFGVCNHTAFNGPNTKEGKGLDMRLYVPVGEKWEIDRHCIPTGEFLPETNHDRQYLTGSQIPVLQKIDNDVFFAEEGSIDDRAFYGAVITDSASGKRVCYEVCKDFKFWVIWNDLGDKEYFCPEPMTWIIDAPNQPIPADESGYRELAPGEKATLTERIYTEWN